MCQNFNMCQIHIQTNIQTNWHLALFDFVWLCMSIYDYVWLCMTKYDFVWLCMTMCEHVWLIYIVKNGGVKLYAISNNLTLE